LTSPLWGGRSAKRSGWGAVPLSVRYTVDKDNHFGDAVPPPDVLAALRASTSPRGQGYRI